MWMWGWHVILYVTLLSVIAVTAFGVFAKWKHARLVAVALLTILVFVCTYFLPAAFARGLMAATGKGVIFRDGVLALSAALHPVHICTLAAGLALALLALSASKRAANG